MKKTLNDITLKSYIVKPVILKKSADIILDKRESLADYLSLGLICLHRTIENSDEKIVNISKRDLSKESSGITAYLGNRAIVLKKDSFMDASCKYVKDIANYICGKECANNMILGPHISIALSVYLCDETFGIEIEENIRSIFEEVLPEKYDINDSLGAQRVAFNLVSKMIKIIIEPFEII